MTTPTPVAGTAVSGAPRSVVLSSRLHVVGALIGLVVAALGILLVPQSIAATKAALAGTDTAGTGIDLDTVATGTVWAAAGLGGLGALVFGVLTVVFAGKMLAGRNWARVVLTVFAGLQVFGVAAPYGLGAVHFIVLVAAVVLSFLAPSNAYFRAQKAARTSTI